MNKENKLVQDFSKYIWSIVFVVGVLIYGVSYYIFNSIITEQYKGILKAKSEIVFIQVESYVTSRIHGLRSVAKKPLLVNGLMQGDVGAIELIEFFKHIEIQGDSGEFSLYAFDGTLLSGQENKWDKSYSKIMDGESLYNVRFIKKKGVIFIRFLFGVDFHGNREGVLEYEQEFSSNAIFQTSEIVPYTITDKGINFSNVEIQREGMIEKNREIFGDKKLSIFLDVSKLVRRKRQFNLIFAVLFILIFLFVAIYTRKKGIEWFLIPHLELEKMSVQVSEMNMLRKSMMDSTKFLFVSTDSNGQIISTNKRSFEITGYSEDELCGLNLQDLFEEKNLEDRASELGKIHELYFDAGFEVLAFNARKGDVEDREWTLLKKDLSDLPITLSMSAIFNEENDLKGFFAIIDDITVIKKAESISKKAIDDIRKAAELKTAFLANMSHEIRTPINGVLGMTDLLKQSSLDKEQSELVELLESSGETLLYLINEILDFSKIEANKIQIENRDFSLKRILDETVLTFNVKAKEKNSNLIVVNNIHNDTYLNSDEFRIKQILNNLLSNAIKFTEGGVVTLEIKVEDNYLNISVKDTGIGMNKDQLKNIFRPFQQADASITRKYGGTGLGLSITKSLVELMNGTIQVKSEVGKGTSFDITIKALSFIKESDLKEVLKNEELLLDRKISILVAEDNKINQKVVSKILGKLALDFEVVENGKAAVEYFKEYRPEYILMDMQMPVMDGLTATKEIRLYEKSKELSPCQIIALTANAFEDDKKSCFEAGMNEYLSKPVKRIDIVRVIKKIEEA
ncbi:MAG: hypothetical protein BM556_01185 [Bacteriovorax sp. MedPE-SWde]|nr:MAG: hypothetical protein BM556_01185 [Bacteriovorax sp. MedPE-SWde]